MILKRRRLDVEHTERRETGDREGGLHTIHEQEKFFNARLRGKRHGIDHRLILAVLRGEGALSHRCYQRGQTRWPIPPKAVNP